MKEDIFEIWYKDIDPDTGNITKQMLLGISFTKNYAKSICQAMNEYDYEPNREYYIIEK